MCLPFGEADDDISLQNGLVDLYILKDLPSTSRGKTDLSNSITGHSIGVRNRLNLRLLSCSWPTSNRRTVPNKRDATCFLDDPERALDNRWMGRHSLIRRFTKEKIGFKRTRSPSLDEGLYATR